MSTPYRFALLDHLQTLIAGMAAPDLLPENFSMSISGANRDREQLSADLMEAARPFEAVKEAERALAMARQAADAAAAHAEALAERIDAACKASLGFDNPKLAALGIKPRPEFKPLSTEQLLVRKLKSAATRVKRGTLGPRQKRAIQTHEVPPTRLVVDDDGVRAVPITSDASSSSTSPDLALSPESPVPK